MATFLSTSNVQTLQKAANLMLAEQARETPFDATVSQVVANAAVSSGFSASTGQFLEAIKLKPYSTLLLFLAYVGGNAAAQASTATAPVLPKQ